MAGHFERLGGHGIVKLAYIVCSGYSLLPATATAMVAGGEGAVGVCTSDEIYAAGGRGSTIGGGM